MLRGGRRACDGFNRPSRWCPRARLQDDPLLAQARADGVGLGEVPALARVVAGDDGGLDLALAEARLLATAGAQVRQERRRLGGHQTERHARPRQLAADDAGLAPIAGVEGTVQVADAIEDQAHRLGGVQVVVHRLGR
jgi:hypothetical protein